MTNKTTFTTQAKKSTNCRRYVVNFDLSHKSHNVPVPYFTIYHSEQQCAHFCCEWGIIGYGTDGMWDLWIRSSELTHVLEFISQTMQMFYIISWEIRDHFVCVPSQWETMLQCSRRLSLAGRIYKIVAGNPLGNGSQAGPEVINRHAIDLIHKSQNAPVPYPTMLHCGAPL